MSKSTNKNTTISTFFTGQKVVYGGVIWAVSALLFFLLFGIGEDRPFWYTIGTYIFEQGAFFAAALLCLKNWTSPQIASGRNVWLGIGLGNFCFGFGGFLFGFWELYWGLDPAVSPGDFFYLLFYLLVGWGMALAVFSRKINLERWQWLTIVGIGTIGIAIGVFLTLTTPAEATTHPPKLLAQAPPAVTPTLPATPAPGTPSPTLTTPRSSSPTPTVSPPVKTSPSNATPTPATPKSPSPVPTSSAKPAPNPPNKTSDKAPDKTPDKTPQAKVGYGGEPPQIIITLEKFLEPYAKLVALVYVIGDVFLLIMATTLLLTFWGGRFAQSWRMVAAASFCMYIADMWFKYASERIPNYESGFVLEVFWVFSGVLFGIGAALEYDNSIRTRRSGRKRA